ncbi:unnamed protein product [Rangifer tarandus platyrhynchus]|uniref:Uncharacterized protein n=2 Tax=Rangifer tarandus platyrhynchus TaxID=3082113 RepID=A0ABN8ZDA9_RANTA|nr:unnamed protein product [Rangifer tarandus platyrhynchus]CAI9706011.1 unnamed protein product [Rangifer tarandus platyrhynchus]
MISFCFGEDPMVVTAHGSDPPGRAGLGARPCLSTRGSRVHVHINLTLRASRRLPQTRLRPVALSLSRPRPPFCYISGVGEALLEEAGQPPDLGCGPRPCLDASAPTRRVDRSVCETLAARLWALAPSARIYRQPPFDQNHKVLTRHLQA